MERNQLVKLILVFAVAGTLFSGYLTFSKLVAGSCPLNEPCPYFLGYPACVYGFVMYSAMFILSLILVLGKGRRENFVKAITGVSVLGIFFSGYFSVRDLFFTPCPGGRCVYTLLVPSCVYGFVMYVVIFVLSVKVLTMKQKRQERKIKKRLELTLSNQKSRDNRRKKT